MPELPEVETVRRILEHSIAGRAILSIEPGDFPDVMGGPPIDQVSMAVAGATITGIDRRAKYLFLRLDTDDVLIAHLRMTGRLLVVPSSAPPVRFEHLAIHLSDGLDLRFGDQRKFGRIVLARPEDADALSLRLGPEPLDESLSAQALHTRLQPHRASIKSILLDQRIIAGLGNIYVDEALFLARVHPLRPAQSVSAAETESLLQTIRQVLQQAIDNQGTTFSTFENPYGERGDNAGALNVYGKGGASLPCPQCGTPLVRLVVAGRGTTFCPYCQPERTEGTVEPVV